jgi:hypothetical chaperone protein
MTAASVGIDFGTTNSSVAYVEPSGSVRLAKFPHKGTTTDSYRSLLYLEQTKERGAVSLRSWTGPEGIEHYLAAEIKGRLIQSLKSFLTNRTLQSTEVFGRRQTIDSLIARILRDLRDKASAQFGIDIRAAVSGRPVRFVGSHSDDDDTYAEGRLREAFHAAGFESVEFEPEPVAAARYYEDTLDRDELILIGDFGGGTSDFSLIRVGPGVQARGRRPEDLLGNAGVGLAGDAFDAKIVKHLVSPALGAGTFMKSVDKTLPVPSWVYSKLERWHHLSFLRSHETLHMLKSVQRQAIEGDRIANLIHLVTEDLGYHLHQSVQKTKVALSASDGAEFHFSDGVIDLDESVQRADFEEWIRPELEQLETCVDGLLAQAGVTGNQVDRVFLTGGTSFVPAVRRIFESRFGADRLRTGNEFTSVAWGLALRAARP